jgi:hypothetical protein
MLHKKTDGKIINLATRKKLTCPWYFKHTIFAFKEIGPTRYAIGYKGVTMFLATLQNILFYASSYKALNFYGVNKLIALHTCRCFLCRRLTKSHNWRKRPTVFYCWWYRFPRYSEKINAAERDFFRRKQYWPRYRTLIL